jgi:transposase
MSRAGRPSLYTQKLAEEICARLADGESLRAICRDDHMPDRSTVLRWEDAHEDFAAKCARARNWQADHEFDRMHEIECGVLDGSIDPQSARVVLSSKQWRASKLAPKKYGDRVTNAHVGPDDGPVQITTDADRVRALAAFLARTAAAKS